MRKMVPIYDSNNLSALIDAGANIILLQHEDITPRPVSSFDKDYVASIITTCHNKNVEVFLQMNLMMHQSHIDTVKDYLRFVKDHQIDGILFGDIGLYELAKGYDIKDKLYFQPGTLTTNVYDGQFWQDKGIKGIFVSREITSDNILKIASLNKIETAMIGHGHLNMFHSKRPLITNFMIYQDDQRPELYNNHELTLIEEKRQEHYPIVENRHGTHVFRANPMHSFDVINQLNDQLDIFMIDSIFKSDAYTIQVLKDYNKVLTDETVQQSLSDTYSKTHDTGFLHKSTVYDTF